ncbi:MAG: hypothetical protein ACRBBQ_06130 [Cognatishimia sp.]
MPTSTVHRSYLSMIGALAGLSLWLLVDVLPDALANQYLLLWIGSVSMGFFALTLGLSGVLPVKGALGVASVWALFCAGLLQWNSQRYLEFDDLFETGFAPLAWGLLMLLGAPFGAALLRRKLWDYSYLFDTAWGIFVRYCAGALFLGLFWALIFLSSALIETVGLSLIEDFLEIDPVPYVLSGLVLGLALAVAQELSDFISPFLILRLIRLLVPLVLGVVAIFLTVLPTRGLSNLFGDFSAAAILMSVTLIAITMITSALDRDQTNAVTNRVLFWSSKALILTLPLLAGLALWSIVVRVESFGWTPQRVAAFMAAGLLCAYALFYIGALFYRHRWMAKIRSANIVMALSVIVLAALWMTPILHAERIAANSQLARYLKGKATPLQFPAWEMQNVWGVAGQNVIARLASDTKADHQTVLTDLKTAKDTTRYQFSRRTEGKSIQELAQQLKNSVVVLSEKPLENTPDFASIVQYSLSNWAQTCGQNDARKCWLLVGPFGKFGALSGILFVPNSKETYSGVSLAWNDGNLSYDRYLRDIDGNQLQLTTAQIDLLMTGDYEIAPSAKQSLWLGGMEIIANN